MRVKVRFFSELARIIGKEHLIEIRENTSVKEALETILKEKKIKLKDIYNDYFIIVNGKVVKLDFVLKGNDEILIVPMIFGGLIFK
ncbi:MAG: MoaD/ThiS family protein [Candidatus Odinarchaeota archaeon]|nr:MoaD/ThiS family protein [Candidatus Odinarchaeota archaeon]